MGVNLVCPPTLVFGPGTTTKPTKEPPGMSQNPDIATPDNMRPRGPAEATVLLVLEFLRLTRVGVGVGGGGGGGSKSPRREHSSQTQYQVPRGSPGLPSLDFDSSSKRSILPVFSEQSSWTERCVAVHRWGP